MTCFLELFEGLPASAPAFRELCAQRLHEPELCVRALSPTTRMILQWNTQDRCARRRRDNQFKVCVYWQEWLRADVAPWSDDARAHLRSVWVATREADATPDGVRELIMWAKETWRAAALGPCPACDCDEPPRKRLRLERSQLCGRCTLRRAIE